MKEHGKPYIQVEPPEYGQTFTPDEVTRNIQELSKNARILRRHSDDPVKKGADEIPAEIMPGYLTRRNIDPPPMKGREKVFRFINGDVSRTYLWVQVGSRGQDSWGLIAKEKLTSKDR